MQSEPETLQTGDAQQTPVTETENERQNEETKSSLEGNS